MIKNLPTWWWMTFALALATLVAPGAAADPQAAAEDDEKDPPWDLQWKDSFRLTSPDGAIALKFGGRLQNDWAFYSADAPLEAAVGEVGDGTEFRRARLFFEGELYDRLELKAQYDFAGGEAKLRDVYLGLINLPVVGGFRVGHYKEPFSLEELTSSKYITFMERALPIEAFSPSYNTGFMLHDKGERHTWALGLFRDADDFGQAFDREEWNLTGRVTYVPFEADGGKRLVHLGLSASEREPTADSVRFRSRPESHLAPRFVDTGSLPASGVRVVDLESAVVWGSFSAQGEYVQTAVDGVGASPDLDFDGFYVFGSYVLTGEHRPYSDGAFGRIKPSRRLGLGPGAWEIALRYSSLDLTDGPVAGGELDDVTVALNWYPFSNVRWMLDYVMADRDGIGQADVIEMRFQVDF